MPLTAGNRETGIFSISALGVVNAITTTLRKPGVWMAGARTAYPILAIRKGYARHFGVAAVIVSLAAQEKTKAQRVTALLPPLRVKRSKTGPRLQVIYF